MILDKASFNSRISISSLFFNYLVGRKTQYFWNNFYFLFFNVDVSIKQGSVLFLVLSALYLSFIFHIFKKRVKNLKIPMSLIFFVDNSLFILQEKSFEKLNSHLFCSYNVILSLLEQFGLVIEHEKTEIFYFSRSQVFNLSPLDLNIFEGPILCPKDIW